MPRCDWADSDPKMQAYHDKEWGHPEHDEQKLFELMSLELMQAGLSWQTVLNKRPALREVFYNFDIQKVRQMDQTDVIRLMQDTRIIRNRLKIEAIINNAKVVYQLKQAGLSLDELLWQTVDYKPCINHFTKPEQVPAKTQTSLELAKKLKKQGFKFLGPTIVYSLMQAAGLVNDHLVGCQA